MSDESSRSPGLVRGPDGTTAAVTATGLAVQSRPLAEILEEQLHVSKQLLAALVLLLGEYRVSVDSHMLTQLHEGIR